MTPMQTDSLDQIVAAAMEAGSIPGLALAVVQNGQLAVAKGYGLANLEHTVPATEHTVYRIASITKTFTATAVMMLAEQDRLDLDESINQYLPYLPASWRAITPRHLLSHTSGMISANRAISLSRGAPPSFPGSAPGARPPSLRSSPAPPASSSPRRAGTPALPGKATDVDRPLNGPVSAKEGARPHSMNMLPGYN